MEQFIYFLVEQTKLSLSIDADSTIKDDEIHLWVRAALEDLSRAGVDVQPNTENWLVIGAVVMFCKANFGMCSIDEKKLAKETYISLLRNLSLSYKESSSND